MSIDGTARGRGFTLVEVLVALAIVALGLVGVFGQLSQSAASASRLRDKTLADWVAINTLTELRLSGLFPKVGTSSGDVEMANTKWHWEMKVSETEVGSRRADVTVSFADKPDRPIAIASGFVAERSTQNPLTSRSAWAPLVPGAESGPGGAPSPAPPAEPPPAVGEAEE